MAVVAFLCGGIAGIVAAILAAVGGGGAGSIVLAYFGAGWAVGLGLLALAWGVSYFRTSSKTDEAYA
ncbi:MAG: hypothetical protein KF887_11675 [Paracoccaceae bacterium]|nr:MAG: hypothetical protein KF887_11675 [Paracoccaceae bacterium]